MLNKIYIHYITTLFVLESFIISCWLLKGKKSESESATKNHDRCITSCNYLSPFNGSGKQHWTPLTLILWTNFFYVFKNPLNEYGAHMGLY